MSTIRKSLITVVVATAIAFAWFGGGYLLWVASGYDHTVSYLLPISWLAVLALVIIYGLTRFIAWAARR
jgi:hypothetical protein